MQFDDANAGKENDMQEGTMGDTSHPMDQLATNINDPNKATDQTLFNNFWLNEIKARDDAIRQLININIIIIATYITIAFNNMLEIITPPRHVITNSSNFLIIFKEIKDLSDQAVVSVFLISIPPLFFLVSIVIALVASSPLDDSEKLLETNTSSDYLKKSWKHKNTFLNYAIIITLVGLVLISIIFLTMTRLKIINLFYQ